MNVILVANEETNYFSSYMSGAFKEKLKFLDVGSYDLFHDRMHEIDYSFFVVIIDNYYSHTSTDKYNRILQFLNNKEQHKGTGKVLLMTEALSICR